MPKFNLLLIGLVILMNSVSAQKSQWLNYTSGAYVFGLAIESNDLWVGTAGGLIKLDKTTGIPTFYNKSNTGLPDNFVSPIAIDATGTKWFSCYQEGLLSFNGTEWKLYKLTDLGIPTNDITSAAADKDGSVWIGTVFGGLVKFDGTNWTIYNSSNSGLSDNDILSIVIDKNGIVWAGTLSGLCRFDGSNWVVFRTSNSGLPSDQISALAISGNNSIWIGTYGSLAKFDGTDWTIFNTANSGLPYNSINIIRAEANGTLWIGTTEGLTKYAENTWTTYTTSNSGLQNNDISSIAVEENGVVWTGSARGGLVSFDGTTWLTHNTSNSGLPLNSVSSITIDKKGLKWIGTSGLGPKIDFDYGLSSFDGIKWSNYCFLNSNLPYGMIRSIATDQSNTIWITTDNGLSEFDGINFKTYNVENSGLPDDHVNTVAIDKSGIKWIGTQNGLVTFDGTSWKTQSGPDWLQPGNNVMSLAIDSGGTVWIGSYSFRGGEGLTTFDGTNWKTYNTSNSGLPVMSVSSIAIEANGTKWIGTFNGGLVKFDGTTWITYNTSNSGLPDNTISAVAFDKSGSEWITTNSGLVKFDGNRWKVFRKANSGLPDDNLSSVSIDDNDSIWIGTSRNGIAVYSENGNASADFSFKVDCNTNPVQFTDLSYVHGGGLVKTRSWNFGDPASGETNTSSLEFPSHLFSSAGTYSVTLICAAADGVNDTMVKQVSVYEPLNVYAGINQVISSDSATVLSGTINGGSGNYSWHWEPADMLEDANVQNPITIKLAKSVVFICTVIDQTTNCMAEDQITVNVIGGMLSVLATANPNQVCSGSTVQFNTLVSGGTGNYTYSWTSDPPGFTSDVSNPTDEPQQTTTYFVNVHDDSTSIVNSIEVQSGICPGQPVISEGPDIVDLFFVAESLYSTTGTTDATSYEWQVIPSNAGIITGTDLSALLSWDKSNKSQTQINVRGINQYGHGPWSEDKITTVYSSVGLNHYENDAIEIYPNPGNGKFKINSSQEIYRIEVLDRLGKKVMIESENSPQKEYNCDYLANGIYFIRIYTGSNRIITRKLVINH